jgi:two-component system sensor histidine kinase KdpD
VAVAARYSRGPALFSSILSIAAFNFLFVPPYYTFNVRDTSYFLTFGVMLVVALTMSSLTARIREQREAAAEREQRTAALYAMQRDLAAASDTPALIDAAVRQLGAVVAGKATILLIDPKHVEGDPDWPEDALFASAEVRVAATWALTHAGRRGGDPARRRMPRPCWFRSGAGAGRWASSRSARTIPISTSRSPRGTR